MIEDGLYGDRFAKLFPMLQNPQPAVVKSLQKGTFSASRLTYSGPDCGPTAPYPPDDAFGLVLRLRHQTADLWINGRSMPKGALKDETSFYDLQSETIVHLKDPFDFLWLYLPRSALAELAAEQGASNVRFNVASGTSIIDPVIAHLGACLLPALEKPQQANELFVGYVALALHTHVLQQFGDILPSSSRSRRGGLAPWQLRVAEEMMNAQLDGNVSVANIARECSVSASHLSRAFTQSVGKPPHRWLIERRVDRAKYLLLDSTRSIAEVALLCGFSDQSHFTRVFSVAVGTSPGRWRRARKS